MGLEGLTPQDFHGSAGLSMVLRDFHSSAGLPWLRRTSRYTSARLQPKNTSTDILHLEPIGCIIFIWTMHYVSRWFTSGFEGCTLKLMCSINAGLNGFIRNLVPLLLPAALIIRVWTLVELHTRSLPASFTHNRVVSCHENINSSVFRRKRSCTWNETPLYESTLKHEEVSLDTWLRPLCLTDRWD